MEGTFIYKTGIPKGILTYPIFLTLIALSFLYYDVPLLTTYFYIVLFGIIFYLIYISRNPLPTIVSVYTDKMMLSFPFRFKKDREYLYENIYSDISIELYKINSLFFLKRYIVVCSFLYGKDVKILKLTITPKLSDFVIAFSLIKHKLQLFKKSINDTLKEGGEETGAHLVNLLENEGLTKEEIVELYKNENIGDDIAESHFAHLEELKDSEIKELKKDYSSAGYSLIAIGLVLIVLSLIMQNGRFIILAVFAFIIGIRTILNSGKIKK